MLLSVIIPYYNTAQYTDELLNVLAPQITEEVEVILIDDGSTVPYKSPHKWVKIIHQENGGQSKTRNRGLDIAKGKYIQFIDSDDLVAPDFIERILEKIPEDPDIIEFSWKSLTTSGRQYNYRIRDGKRLSNPSACTRSFKRSYIDQTRFSELKDATEDEDFSRRLGFLRDPDVKVSVIPEYMYFYRTDVDGSNTKTYKQGQRRTKRIVYYYGHVAPDRTDILEQIRKDDEQNEVILLTNNCEMPELYRWCQVLPPCRIWTHYQKGERFNGCVVIPIPIRAQVILFIHQLHIIGGIETFVYQFVKLMCKSYDIALVIENIDNAQRQRLERFIPVYDYNKKYEYACDTLIMLRILDKMPRNIDYKQSVQMVHGCRTNFNWHIPQWTRYIVTVSQAAKDSFGQEAKDGIVIHNPIGKNNKKALILVSATRIPAPDKGAYEYRMRLLADMLNEADIPFVWFNFSEGQIANAPEGMVNMGKRQDIAPYIARADYLVQLSDSEAWSYSILEALTQNTPVLVCPFPSAAEMGIRDGDNGYIIPFDMEFDVKKLLKVPRFKYESDNGPIMEAWKRILDHEEPAPDRIALRVVMPYIDTVLDRQVNAGEVISVTEDRAKVIEGAGFGKRVR